MVPGVDKEKQANLFVYRNACMRKPRKRKQRFA